MIEAAIERYAGEDREQDGGDDGDHAEQTDDTGMKLRAGNLPPTREPKGADLPGDNSQHGEHEHEIDEQNAHDHKMRRHDGGEAGQNGVGGEARAQREHHGDQAEREGQTTRADGIALWGDGCHGCGSLLASVRRFGRRSARAPKRHTMGRVGQGLENATQPLSPALPCDLKAGSVASSSCGNISPSLMQ